jgi:hypothetical protein
LAREGRNGKEKGCKEERQEKGAEENRPKESYKEKT